MLSEPQSVTVNAVAQSLPRVNTEKNKGVFRKEDGAYTLTVSHDYGTKRNRHLIRLDSAKIAADPLTAGINVRALMDAHLVIDAPITGYTNTEIKYVADALVAWLAASSGANITKVLGGES